MIGYRTGFDASAAAKAVAALDPARAPRTADDARHVTRGKHNNTAVLAAIRRLPFVRAASSSLAEAVAGASFPC